MLRVSWDDYSLLTGIMSAYGSFTFSSGGSFKKLRSSSRGVEYWVVSSCMKPWLSWNNPIYPLYASPHKNTYPVVVRHAAWLCLSDLEQETYFITRPFSSNKAIFLGLFKNRPPFFVKVESSLGFDSFENIELRSSYLLLSFRFFSECFYFFFMGSFWASCL